MTAVTDKQASATMLVYRIYIKATPQAIWDAITQPEWTLKYGYASRVEYQLRKGGGYKAFATDAMRQHGAPDVIIVGEILESDPPRKLVQTWHPIWSPEAQAEQPTRLTFEIDADEGGPGVTRLTLTHDVTGAPSVAAMVSSASVKEAGGGWSYVLSDLKTLLESGKALAS